MTELIRLNRFIANAGVCSRREADEIIKKGRISVNGKKIVEMGFKVAASDAILLDGKPLKKETFVYILLNKPKDFITTAKDPQGRKTVFDLIKNATEERVFSVGRLDRHTTGLLLFTNDGDLTQKLTHPSNKMSKLYQVTLNKPINEKSVAQIQEGVKLEDGVVKIDDFSIISADKKTVGIELHSGKNRVVRRIFEALGYRVVKLDRTVFAGLTKKDLPRGKWRTLKKQEVIQLKHLP